MTKKSTPNPFANVCNVVLMLNRDELRANAVPVKDDAALIERLKVNTQRKIDAILLERLQALNAAAMKRATSGGRRRYYEAS